MSLPLVQGWMAGSRALAGRLWHVIAPAGVALALGLWGISASGPWSDEVQTIDALVMGLTEHVWEAPLLPYYAIMLAWSAGGQIVDITWLRLLSVLAVMVAAAATSLTAARLSTRWAGLMAGLSLAIAPGVSRYSQEARPYSLALALTATASLFLVLALTQGDRRWWVGYGILLASTGILLPISLAIIPAHAVIILLHPDWRPKFAAWFRVCLLLTPLAVLEASLAALFGRMHEWLDRPALTDAFQDTGFLLGSATSGAAFAAAILALACVSRAGRRWLAGWLIAVTSVLVLSLTVMSWWTPRTFVPLVALICVAASFGVAHRRWQSSAAVVVLLALLAAPTLRADREPDSRGVDAEQLAAVLDLHGLEGDVVVADPGWPYLGWAHRLFLNQDPRFTEATTAAGDRWWELTTTPTCSDYVEWHVAGNIPLRLCR